MIENKSLNSEQKGFAVEPKINCPHFKQNQIKKLQQLIQTKSQNFYPQSCKVCSDINENWICLKCKEIFCSRYINSHMQKHNQENKEKHKIVFSFSDCSFWCYDCDSYITNNTMLDFARFFSQNIKQKPQEQNLQQISQSLEELKLKEKIVFTKQDFINGLKEKKYKKIVVLTGAGISVSAGIPDFRSPGTGLYSQIQKYNLPFPEAIFTLSYFKNNPQPFYHYSKQFQDIKNSFTINHYFIKKLNEQGVLLMNFTQNVDGLELDAGLPKNKLIQSHGHNRSARCIECRSIYDIQKFNEHVQNGTIAYCNICDQKGLIKPDVVFFGEKLPFEYTQQAPLIKKADLVIVMGTSLMVQPFSDLVLSVDSKIPLVLINRENKKIKDEDNFLFIPGDLDQNIKEIMIELGWEFPEFKKKDPLQYELNDGINIEEQKTE